MSEVEVVKEVKFSVREIVTITDSLGPEISSVLWCLLSGELDFAMWSLLNSRFNLGEFFDTDLGRALANWDFLNESPHTHDAILVLVEELLVENRDN